MNQARMQWNAREAVLQAVVTTPHGEHLTVQQLLDCNESQRKLIAWVPWLAAIFLVLAIVVVLTTSELVRKHSQLIELPSSTAPTSAGNAAEQTAFSAVAKTLVLITPVLSGDDVYKAKAIVKPAQCEVEVRREHSEQDGPLVPWLVRSLSCR